MSNRKEVLRRIEIWVLVICTVGLLITGIFFHDRDPMVLHIVLGSLFTVACVRHVVARRKAFKRAIMGK